MNFPSEADRARMDEIREAVLAFIRALERRPKDQAPPYWYLTEQDAREVIARLVQVRPDTAVEVLLGWLGDEARLWLRPVPPHDEMWAASVRKDVVRAEGLPGWFISVRDRLRAVADGVDELLNQLDASIRTAQTASASGTCGENARG